MTRQLVAVDTPVVLEIGLIRRGEREAFYRRVEDAGFELTIHLLDADRDVRRERVMRRNQEDGVVQVVPLELFEMASDLWEAPDDIELSARDVRVR
jgi:predicted kinase